MPDPRFDAAIARIDAANGGDPHTIVVDGEERPKEQAHAELMTEWVRRLDPAATDAQLLAARAHHLRRWSIPRSSYPDGRVGYLKWRTALKNQHGEEVSAILAGVGYDEETIARVRQIVRKDGLRTDPQVQVHEDALCMVFLETQLVDLADQLGEEHCIEVVRKTLAKMSERGIAAAGSARLDDEGRRLLEAAVSSAP